MYVDVKDIEISGLNGRLCSMVSFAIKQSLKKSIEDHYSQLQQSDYGRSLAVFRDQEKDLLRFMVDIGNASGRTHDDSIDELDQYLKEVYFKKHPDGGIK